MGPSRTSYFKRMLKKAMTQSEKMSPKGVLNNLEDRVLKWVDDFEIDIDDETSGSESSEEESDSVEEAERKSSSIVVQEIWNQKILWAELMALPDAQEIHDFILGEDIDAALKKNKQTCMLISAWIGKVNVIKILLEKGMVSPNVCDGAGRTALHLAAYAGKSECARALLERGGEANAWDGAHQATPLHCAACGGHLGCLRLLLRHGADVNAGVIGQRSPLHYAVQSMAVDCVRELLQHHATPNTPQVYSEAPLHVAATVGNVAAIRLLLAAGAAIEVQCGNSRSAPLHLAAEHGDAECVRVLLGAGANVAARNRKRQTPLHLAALAQCSETMELLLAKGADPNAQDSDGRTPLHCSTVNVQRSCECVRLLLEIGADVNRADVFGYTPMHLAALNEFSPCVLLFLGYGGDVTARTNGGISVLNFITKKTPDVIPKYIAKFDASIRLNNHDIGDVDCQVKLDFRLMVPSMGHHETSLMLNFIEVGHKQVLTHPLCETFLFLKWRKIRKFFLFSLIYHSLFVSLFTLYIIGVFLNACNGSCPIPFHVRNIGHAVIVFDIILMSKEVFQICQAWRPYIKEWENWLQWFIIISVFCVVYIDSMFKHHIAAVAIFMAWVELMMIVGRFPAFGLYVQMFATVSINFVKFMMAYFCLFIAFSLSFAVIFANYAAFQDLKWVLLKVIIMMSGELEYEDIFFPNKDNNTLTDKDKDMAIKYPYTAHLMFLCFVLLVTVILTNLMVGLAVNDIQGLQQSAGLDRLVRLAKLMAHLEGMLFSKLLRWVPTTIMQFLHRKALLLRSQRDWTLDIRPNDPRESRIPKDLIQNIYQLVASRKDRPRSKRFRATVITPPLSRYSSYNSSFKNRNKKNKVENKIEEKSKEMASEIQKLVKRYLEEMLKHA